MPSWVDAGYKEYAKRLPKECELVLKEITPGVRGKNCDVMKIMTEEGERIQEAIPKDALIVALDLSGKAASTVELSAMLKDWLAGGRNVALLVGGADGLSAQVKARANAFWCLSPLTFPHPLVRIIIAEQLYRAWTILANHPYHR